MGREDDAKLLLAAQKMAQLMVKGTDLWHYRDDIVQNALLYVLQGPEPTATNVASKARSEFLDEVKRCRKSVTFAATDTLIAIEERKQLNPLPFGLYQQELQIYARQELSTYKKPLRKSKSYRQDRDEKIVELAKQGIGPTQIAARFGLRYESIRQILRKYGVPPEKRYCA